MSEGSRRDLLRAAGAGALGVPWARPLAAAPLSPPRRFVLVWRANGAVQSDFWPESGTTDSPLLEPLAAHAQQLTIIKGVVQHGSGDHKYGAPFSTTGFAVNPVRSISIDQLIASAGGKPALVLTGKAKPQNYRGWCSYDRGGATVLPIEDPRAAFAAVFGDPGGGPGDHRPALEAKVLATADADAAELRRQAPAAEAIKLDQQRAALTGIARRLAAVQGGRGACPSVQVAPYQAPAFDYPTRIKLHMDLIVGAFACDARRVATLMMSPGGHDSMSRDLQFLGIELTGDIHNTHAHYVNDTVKGPANRAIMNRVTRWELEQFAYLLRRLKDTRDGDGRSLFDSTTILLTSECKDPNHGPGPIPIVVAGGGGRLETGKVLDGSGGGGRYCDILISCARAAGADVTRFGQGSSGPFAPLGG